LLRFDADADVVNHRFTITDASGKPRDFGAYNRDKGYAEKPAAWAPVSGKLGRVWDRKTVDRRHKPTGHTGGEPCHDFRAALWR
jgi:hypothetical protein